MKIYDSTNLPLQATVLGAVITLVANPIGTPVPLKAMSTNSGNLVLSGSVLGESVKDINARTQTITVGTLSGGNAVTIGAQTFTAGTEFAVGGSPAATASNLAAAIDAAQVFGPQPAWVLDGENWNFEAKLTGSGAISCNANIETSLNGVDWEVPGSTTFALTGTGSDTKYASLQRPKPLMRTNTPSFTGTVTRLEIWAKQVGTV